MDLHLKSSRSKLDLLSLTVILWQINFFKCDRKAKTSFAKLAERFGKEMEREMGIKMCIFAAWKVGKNEVHVAS